MTRIALIGNLAVDRVSGGEPRAGGGVFWGARAAAHVRADAVVVTRCAPADRGVALAPLEALGVPVACEDASRTTAFSFSYEGDRRVMTVDAVGDPWSPGDIEGWASASLTGAAWVHVAGLLRSDFPPPTISALARGGRRLLLDAQGLVRVARSGQLAEAGDVERTVFGELAILKADEGEARLLAGSIEPRDVRSLGVPEVVLTLGSRGAVLVTQDAVAEIPPRPVSGPVDPTGAGDAFALVYLDARARGMEPAEAARRASQVAGELISGP